MPIQESISEEKASQSFKNYCPMLEMDLINHSLKELFGCFMEIPFQLKLSSKTFKQIFKNVLKLAKILWISSKDFLEKLIH